MRNIFSVKQIITILIFCFVASETRCKDVNLYRGGRSLKILMMIPNFPKISDNCMLNQITGLLDRGHDVYVYAQARGTAKVQEEIHTYDLINRTFYKLPGDLNSFDIIVFQLGHKAFDIKRKWRFNGKVVICLRGYDMSGHLKKHPKAYRDLFKSCDLFLPVCNFFKDKIIQLGCDPSKVVVLHSAINCSRFKFKKRNACIKNGKISIVSAGRFVEKKGFEYAIRAIAQLIKKYPCLEYRIIGGGRIEKRLRKLIKRLKVGKNIKIVSWLTHSELIKVLNKSHFVIAPSVTADNGDQEGIPNVLKEAMAMGLPVISTLHAGIPELIKHEVSGFLVSPKNIGQLVQAIDYLIMHPGQWHSIGLAGRTCIQEAFDIDCVNDKLEKTLLQLIS